MNEADPIEPDGTPPARTALPLSDPLAAAASGLGSSLDQGAHPRNVPDQKEIHLSPNEQMGVEGSPLHDAVAEAEERAEERIETPEEPEPEPAHTPAEGPVPLTPNRSEGVHLSTLPWDITDADDRSLPPWFRRAVITVLVLAVVMNAVLWGFSALEDFWYTLFFSFFMGLAIEPIVNVLAARGLRRGSGDVPGHGRPGPGDGAVLPGLRQPAGRAARAADPQPPRHARQHRGVDQPAIRHVAGGGRHPRQPGDRHGRHRQGCGQPRRRAAVHPGHRGRLDLQPLHDRLVHFLLRRRRARPSAAPSPRGCRRHASACSSPCGTSPLRRPAGT